MQKEKCKSKKGGEGTEKKKENNVADYLQMKTRCFAIYSSR